ncbi:hypothetical protein CJ030_MR1G008457 [Morella rubra]|uniref:Non-structural maintenance of chromosomes element 4 n=1 Tax=Morella rubra TaxID=262757 RepID=A0A6A1WNE5_9ROSI|nr:hypothetical protein CJ030_MR1G008457 [Morella rubra]
MVRIVKGELGCPGGNTDERVEETCESEASDSEPRGDADRRVLRSRYLALKSLISDERDDMTRVDSDKFQSIINEVDKLQNLVQKPREQVADAEALLDITDALLASVKAHNSEGINSADFVTCLLRDFGKQSRPSGITEDVRGTIFWKDIGLSVSHVFRRCPGCCTMIGPMNTELKQRKTCVRRKRVRPTESAHPDGFDDAVAEERTETDTNMSIMFNILKKNRSVKLENLVLNRNSFAQTVENLFALSFLVKDGRAEITVNEKGCHFVSPRNAPSASAVKSRDAAYRHFVFRLDFNDWKLMTHSVGVGEELMLHRNQDNMSSNPEVDPLSGVSQAAVSTTPIWKLCRNRGLVLQEHSVVEGSPTI